MTRTTRSQLTWGLAVVLSLGLLLVGDIHLARPHYEVGTIQDHVITTVTRGSHTGPRVYSLRVVQVETGQRREVLVTRDEFYNPEHDVGRAVVYVDHRGLISQRVWVTTLNPID